MISHESITKLKEIAKLTEVVHDYIKLKKSGSEFIACCPFHNEKTPSFKIRRSNDFYKCFGCGKSGDVFSFIIEIENCSFHEAVKKVANKYNFELDIISKDYVKPIHRIEKINPAYINWFEKRGISNNTLLRFQITQGTEWMPKSKMEVPVVCFNYFKKNELVNIKFRGPGKDFKLAKDAELIFYNIDAIEDKEEVVIVEGEIDCLSMYEAGIYNCISVPNGTSPKGNMQLKYLDNCYEYFVNKKKIVIATDNDNVGKLLKEELSRRLGKEICYQIEYPIDCKDSNDILNKYGKETLRNLVENAKQFPIEGIVSNDEIEQEIWDYYKNGYPKGIEIGIPGLDDHVRLMEGQITIVTGIPGSGKSEFTDYIMSKTSINHDWKWAICSFENTPPVFHATKIIEKLSGRAFDYRIDPLNRVSEFELDITIGHLKENFNFINTTDTDITIDGILSKTTELVLRKGIKGLLIDPWNYIEHNIPNGFSETQYVSECLTKIKKTALKLGIHIIIIAHPTKLQKDKTTGKYEVPTLYSISGSAHFFNKTDNGITVYRDFSNNLVTIYIQKVRYSWLGKIGFINFNYNTYTRQYEYTL
jgi:twinkle protein